MIKFVIYMEIYIFLKLSNSNRLHSILMIHMNILETLTNSDILEFFYVET